MAKKPATKTRVITAPPGRQALLTALAAMPAESWGWFVLWAAGNMTQFPDGLGGFSDESRKSIQALRKAAAKYMAKL